MAIDLATLPQFLTRDDAADLLRMTTRSIDTMVGDGRLAKVKLGTRKTGITRESMIEHLQRSGLALPDKPTVNAGQLVADYQSRIERVVVDLPDGADAEWLAMACTAVDNWLPRHGLKGCHVAGNMEARCIAVIWHHSLGYSPKKVGRVLMALDRDISHAGK